MVLSSVCIWAFTSAGPSFVLSLATRASNCFIWASVSWSFVFAFMSSLITTFRAAVAGSGLSFLTLFLIGGGGFGGLGGLDGVVVSTAAAAGFFGGAALPL